MLTRPLTLPMVASLAADGVTDPFGGSSPAPLTALEQLVADLGGQSAVPWLYDTERNVVSSGASNNVFESIADYYGRAGIPDLVAKATNKPGWDDTNKLITFNGAQWAETAASAALALGNNYTYVLISANSAVNAIMASLVGTAVARRMELSSDSTGLLQTAAFTSTGAIGTAKSAISSGAAMRVRWGGFVAGKVHCQVYDRVDVQTATTGDYSDAGDTKLGIGARPGGVAPATGSFKTLFALNRVPSAADWTLIRDFAAASRGAVAA